MIRKLIILILLIAIGYNIFRSYRLFDFKKVLNNKFDIKKYEKLYNQSQWVIPNSKNPVSDDVIYTYAGAKYINGENPIMINAEHPPMLKNLIGVFAVYFHNEYLFSLLSAIFAIMTFFLLANLILKDRLVSLLLSSFLFFEPLMVANYFLTLLDLFTFGLINLYFFSLVKYRKDNKISQLILMNIILGFIISSKFLLLAIPLIGTTIIYFLLTKKLKSLFYYFLFLIISLFILVANYWQFFLKGKNIIDFLRLQKYIFTFHTQGRKEYLFLNSSLFTLIFAGKFYPDLKNITKEAYFTIFWPISFLLSSLAIFCKKMFSPLIIWIILYSCFQLTTFINARYLIILLPYLYLVSTSFVLSKRKIND